MNNSAVLAGLSPTIYLCIKRQHHEKVIIINCFIHWRSFGIRTR